MEKVQDGLSCNWSWSFSVDSKIFKSNLSSYEKLLYTVLLSHLSPDGNTCFPSINRLAQEMSCSGRTVARALETLRSKKIIIKHNRFIEKNGRQTSNLYVLQKIPDEFLVSQRHSEDGGVTVSHGHKINDLDPTPLTDSQGEGDYESLGRVTVSHPLIINHKEHIPGEQKEKNTPSEMKLPSVVSPKNTPHFVRSDEKPIEPHRTKESLLVEQNEQKTQPRDPLQMSLLSDIPIRMKQTADYFLLKTGRMRITESDIAALKKLDEIHTASRINQEIGHAVARFTNIGRKREALTLGYILDSLKHQCSIPKKSNTNSPPSHSVESTNYSNYNVDNVVKIYNSGVFAEDELFDLCDMYKLSESEREEVFSLIGYNNGGDSS